MSTTAQAINHYLRIRSLPEEPAEFGIVGVRRDKLLNVQWGYSTYAIACVAADAMDSRDLSKCYIVWRKAGSVTTVGRASDWADILPPPEENVYYGIRYILPNNEYSVTWTQLPLDAIDRVIEKIQKVATFVSMSYRINRQHYWPLLPVKDYQLLAGRQIMF